MKRFALLLALMAPLAACTGEGLIDQYTNNYDYKQQVWNRVDAGVQDDLTGMQWVDGSTAYVVGDQGLVLKTADAGATFTADHPAVMKGKKLLSVSFVSPSVGFVASAEAVFTTQDGGASWTSLGNPANRVKDQMLRVRFVTAGAGYAAGVKQAYQTLDGGKNWQPLELVNVRDFEVTANQVYAGGGNIYRAQVGTGWDGLLSADKACQRCTSWISFPSSTEGWAVIAGQDTLHSSQAFAVMHTLDGGGSWTVLPTQNHEGKAIEPYVRGASLDSLRALRMTDAKAGWMIFGGGMLSTFDGGQTWVPQHQAFLDLIGQTFNTYFMEHLTTFGFQDLQVQSPTSAWVVGDKGRIYKYTGQAYPVFHDK